MTPQTSIQPDMRATSTRGSDGDRIEPQNLLSYRLHPYPADPAADYTKELSTLVTFTPKDAPGKGTLLTVVESG
ncbi:MAG: SRPBCC family protein [Casimicrobiaceae bacterium]